MKLKIILVTLVLGIVAGVAGFFWNASDIKILEKTETEFGSIWVYEEKDERCMSFLAPPTHLIQSCMSLSTPKKDVFSYTKILLSSLFIKGEPRKILMIGMGGASLAKSLNILAPYSKIDIVEINPAIPVIVEKYFEFRAGGKNRVIVEDGFEFVKNAESDQYDLVIVDAFTPDYIPPSFLTDEFMKNMKRVTARDGVVAINTFSSGKHYDLESGLIKKHFGAFYNLQVGGNRIIIATKADLPTPAEVKAKSLFWRFRMVELGIGQVPLAALYTEESLR